MDRLPQDPRKTPLQDTGGPDLRQVEGLLPNALTLLRIILVPFFIGTLSYGYYGYSLAIFISAGITDLFDGFLARIKKQKTRIGALLDPIADKALLISSFITLTILGWMPRWLTIIVISRDVILITGNLSIYILTGTLKVSPSILGKLTTNAQILLIAFTLMTVNLRGKPYPLPLLLWLVAILTISSGLHYIYDGLRRVS